MNPHNSARFRDLMELTPDQIFKLSQIVPTQPCPCCEGPGYHLHEVEGETLFGIPLVIIHQCDTCNGQGRVIRMFSN